MERMIPILQFVGFKKSGKTTVITQLINSLAEGGIQIGVIKHHGHGGTPDFFEADYVDSSQFYQRGASLTSVEGDGMIVTRTNRPERDLLEAMIQFHISLSVDLIFIEGYKKAPYPKIALVRNAEDWNELAERCERIIGVIQQHELSELESCELPIFTLEDSESYITHITEWFKNERKDNRKI
jgi:molybdopterin-guanine dinucleotide biosynthesis protein B